MLIEKSTQHVLTQMDDDWLKEMDQQPLILLTITSVFFNGNFSIVKHVGCGVPQGSSPGPATLFYFFTNDLLLALNKDCVSMYADD